ncbi:hypothetical protein E2C01_007561 [Portunus trituberculatus]|uniref:Uncharacterized protein n=1 Tax=Portunus trituberculatus TaxID=210409 RepID=A0A5B7D2R2_PORTR|nr:hypothetical protein [Portunus trituberculatus]
MNLSLIENNNLKYETPPREAGGESEVEVFGWCDPEEGSRRQGPSGGTGEPRFMATVNCSLGKPTPISHN